MTDEKTQQPLGVASHLTQELEPRVVTIAKEYLEKDRIKLYNPDYIIQQLLIEFTNYEPASERLIFNSNAIFNSLFPNG